MSARWMTSAEVAELLRVRPATVAQWRWRRKGPAFVKLEAGPAGRVRYAAAEVRKYMADPSAYEAKKR